MQEAVRTNFSALTALKHQFSTVRQEKEEAEAKLEEIRMKYRELEV